MKTYSTYELSKATFEVEDYSEDQVAALPPADLLLLAHTAESQWSYRRGARAESHGKRYSLTDMVADIRATGTNRPGKVTKADIDNADKALKFLWTYVKGTWPDGAEGYTPEELQDARHADMWSKFEDQVAKREKEFAYSPERPEVKTHESMQAWLPNYFRGLRLAIDRVASKEKKNMFS